MPGKQSAAALQSQCPIFAMMFEKNDNEGSKAKAFFNPAKIHLNEWIIA